MGSSTRAQAPPPLNIGTARSATAYMSSSPKSADSGHRSYSSDDYPEYSPPPSYSRKASESSVGSSSKKAKGVNAHSYCGRHSDQYLFGGHSIGELWRSVTKKE
ncbi:hypothetical protein B0T22DRAFT_435524 [Podospora appendiculata]|uniref:Uncharacterized protein n=1 Tax=Podospora appendiculata TaxID=314037 RepID=A0AAE1CFA3_9PEZI|nr:hypothetical protein B0T22DRAFT_435524 [Podospora appendiculata]